MIDRRIRAYLTEFWHAQEISSTGSNLDFIYVKKDGSCTFILSKYAGTGTLEYDASKSGFELDFQHREQPHLLRLRCGINQFGWRSVDVSVSPVDAPDSTATYHSPLSTSPPDPEATPLPKGVPGAVPQWLSTPNGIEFTDPPPLEVPSLTN